MFHLNNRQPLIKHGLNLGRSIVKVSCLERKSMIRNPLGDLKFHARFYSRHAQQISSNSLFQSKKFFSSSIHSRINETVHSRSNKAITKFGEIVELKYSFFRDNFLGRIFKSGILLVGITGVSIVALLGAFFIYDATTYSNIDHSTPLKVSALAVNPRIGGPEKLPIVEDNLDDYDEESKELLKLKPRLVILGSGWGSVGILKTLKPGEYNVTLISPTNYFLFTPLLPSAAASTLTIKSLTESIRRILYRVHGHFVEGSAEKIDFDNKLIKVASVDANGHIQKFYVPYDKLVVAVGSTSNTHGVKGLEYSHQLKTAADARLIRRRITDLLEKACLPTTTDEERKKMLSFVVCGGGPTGVEFAAEVYDFLNEDLIKNNYPQILRKEISVHIIQSRSNILNTYDQAISDYATQRFKNDCVDVLTNSRVEEILPDAVIFKQTDPNTGSVEYKKISFGLCLWSTGVAQNPLAKQIVDDLGKDHQRNKRAIETDAHLRVIGTPLGDVYAIGDCSTVRTGLAENSLNLVRRFLARKYMAEINHGRFNDIAAKKFLTDDEVKQFKFSKDVIVELAKDISVHIPQSATAFKYIDELIESHDIEKKGELDYGELVCLFKEIESKITSLPATAQRANQQGVYLGRKLSKIAKVLSSGNLEKFLQVDIDSSYSKPFLYKHLGSLAYIGNSAVFDLGNGNSFFGGLIAMYLWRGVYFSQSVSFRTQVLLFMDWLKRGFFGRDSIDT